jgi:molybdate transport system substrate-binding protein
MKRPRNAVTILSLVLCVVVALACESAQAGRATGAAPAPAPREDRLLVFAATSLKDAFDELAKEFERSHQDVELTFNFAGTQELRTQLEQGAPADVFASADMMHMSELWRTAYVTAPEAFARNEPVVIVAKESAAIVQSIADLAKTKRLVFGLPQVPIGRYTQKILDRASTTLGADFRARVEANVVSLEPNVRQVLAKVSLGEAQAGVVYRTDALTAKNQVSIVVIPREMNVVADYPIAVVSTAQHPKLAKQWIELVVGAEGQRVLGAHGFLPAASSASL